MEAEERGKGVLKRVEREGGRGRRERGGKGCRERGGGGGGGKGVNLKRGSM